MHESRVPLKIVSPNRIAPTQIETAQKCSLRFVLDRCVVESDMQLPSSSAFRYVGTIFHGVIAASRSGEAGDPPNRSQLELIWRQLLIEAEEKARQSGDEVWLPLRESVPYIERTRLWALQLALKQQVYEHRGTGTENTETWVESEDGSIAGRLDAIEYRDRKMIVQDFKSGDVFDSSGEIKTEYSTQMLVYAALLRERRGRWPDELELIDRVGNPIGIQFSPERATELLHRTKELLRSIQERIHPRCSIEDDSVSGMADPQGGACATCRHRPVCLPYLARLGEHGMIVHGRSDYSLVDSIGVLDKVTVTNSGRVHLDYRHKGNLRTIQGLTQHGRFTDANSIGDPPRLPSSGDLVAVFGSKPRRPLDSQQDALRFVVSRSVRAFRMPERVRQMLIATISEVRATGQV